LTLIRRIRATSNPQTVSAGRIGGDVLRVEIRKVIQRRIRTSGGGVDLASDVNAVISANVNRGHSDRAAQRETDPPKTDAPKEETHE
jgi:hypothetical protein